MSGKFTYAEQMRREMDDIVFSSNDAEEALLCLLILCQRKRLVKNLSISSGISDSSIYNAIKEKGSPRLVTAKALFNTLGYDIKVVKR